MPKSPSPYDNPPTFTKPKAFEAPPRKPVQRTQRPRFVEPTKPGLPQIVEQVKLKQTIRKEVNARLHQLGNKAADALEERIQKGDTRAIVYALERILPKHGEIMSIPLAPSKLQTIEDVTATAESITLAFLDQSISKTEAEGAMGVLTKYAALRLAQHMGELEGKISDIEARTGLDLNENAVTAAMDAIPSNLLPQWGGIAEKLLDD